MDNPFRPSEKYSGTTIVITAAAAFAALAFLAFLDQTLSNPYLVASFGATAVLIYGAPKAPFSKPKNVFFGHLFSGIIGIATAFILVKAGCFEEWKWAGIGIAGCLAIITMMLTGTIHPPGGATAITCVISGFASIDRLFVPIMLGVVIMMGIAYCANYAKERLQKERKPQDSSS
ncbi:MAG: HPP family protein [Candidatus Methanomethylophilaceae archaeon]|nr:HPP family protein [Candidatus Methanomethylophilaceae archaeon]